MTHERASNLLDFNGPFVKLFDQGFATFQVMAIRRLTDPVSYDPKRAVFSLPSIIEDMKEHAELFTRENYVCNEGLQYEIPVQSHGDLNWITLDRIHKTFDRLTGSQSKTRSRSDVIKVEVFTKLSNELRVCEGLRTYANRFIAHASHARNRFTLRDTQRRLTFERLEKCLKATVRVASFIGSISFYEHSLGGVPVPQFNQFKNLDKPMVAGDDIDKLSAFWTTRVKEVDGWDDDLWALI